MAVVFHPAAEEELRESAAFYEQHYKGLGVAFVAAVEHTIERITENPKAGTLMNAKIRRRLVPGFPFGVIYSQRAGETRILAIMHLRRRPGYWRDR